MSADALTLAARREQLGLTQAQMAKKIGMSRCNLSRLETGFLKGEKASVRDLVAKHYRLSSEWVRDHFNSRAPKQDRSHVQRMHVRGAARKRAACSVAKKSPRKRPARSVA